MRIRFPAAAVLAAGLAFAAPALAEKGAPAPPVVVAPAPPQNDTSRDMGRIAEASKVYKDLVLESEALMELVLDGVGRAIDTDNPPSQAWLADWKAKVKTSADLVRAHRDALPPFPSEVLKPFESDPQMQRMKEALTRLPESARASADTMLDLARDLTPLVEAAAGGDELAQLKLIRESSRGYSAALKAENVMLDLAIGSTFPSHPQASLSRSMKASNEAMILLFDYLQVLADGGDADPEAMVRAVRAKLDESRAEARKIGPQARFLVQRLGAEPDTPFKTRIIAAFATYDGSGQVELQIADVLEKGIAALVASPEADNNVLQDDLAPLVERRMALQDQRVAALTR